MTSLARWATDAAASFPSTVILRRATMKTSTASVLHDLRQGEWDGQRPAPAAIAAILATREGAPEVLALGRGEGSGRAARLPEPGQARRIHETALLLLDVVLEPGDVDLLGLPPVLLGRQPLAPIVQGRGSLPGQLLPVAIEAVLGLEARGLGLLLDVDGGGGDPGPAEPQAKGRRHRQTDLRVLLHALRLFDSRNPYQR